MGHVGFVCVCVCLFQKITLFSNVLSAEISPDLVSQLANPEQTDHVQGKGRGQKVKDKGHG